MCSFQSDSNEARVSLQVKPLYVLWSQFTRAIAYEEEDHSVFHFTLITIEFFSTSRNSISGYPCDHVALPHFVHIIHIDSPISRFH